MIKKLANYIIRPQRVVYVETDLGEKEFVLNEQQMQRDDFELKNKKNLTIKGSMFMKKGQSSLQHQNCVIFCHGNSGNRTSIFECLNFILERGFVGVAFDFSGCGNSEGDHITLGHKESFDLESIVDYVKSFRFISKIAIWGRSMGAATTLLYVKNNPLSVHAICLDSPFSNLKKLIFSFISKFKIFADIFGDILYQKVKTQIQEECGFDIETINPIEASSNVRVPAIFLHALHDSIIDKEHSDQIVKLYKGRKKYFNFSGGHNDLRNDNLYVQVMDFFEETFQKAIPSITLTQSVEETKIDHSLSFNPINFSSTSINDKVPSAQELQEDRHYISRQGKRSKIYFKSENLINMQNEHGNVRRRTSTNVQELTVQRKQSVKQNTILLRNFVELTDESEDEEDQKEADSMTYHPSNKMAVNVGLNIPSSTADSDSTRPKSGSFLKSQTYDINYESEKKEKLPQLKKRTSSSSKLPKQQFDEFDLNDDDDDLGCENLSKNLPNSDVCFSFKKYANYKHSSLSQSDTENSKS